MQRRVDPTEVVKLYEQGMSPSDIAMRFSVTPSYVRYILRKAGFPAEVKRTPPDVVAKIIELYKQGITTGELARQFGISAATVRNVLRKHGIKPQRRFKREWPEVTCPRCGRRGTLYLRATARNIAIRIWHGDRLCTAALLVPPPGAKLDLPGEILEVIPGDRLRDLARRVGVLDVLLQTAPEEIRRKLTS
ncbi:MAG: helix-turn-helix domain-containing protein [Pyrobaculum sp.]